jgi:hypothetical protein
VLRHSGGLFLVFLSSHHFLCVCSSFAGGFFSIIMIVGNLLVTFALLTYYKVKKASKKGLATVEKRAKSWRTAHGLGGEGTGAEERGGGSGSARGQVKTVRVGDS